MSSNLKTYTIRGKIICTSEILFVNKATVKNCYTSLQAKVKFEEACKKRYPTFIRCEISSCLMDMESASLSDLLGNFSDFMDLK